MGVDVQPQVHFSNLVPLSGPSSRDLSFVLDGPWGSLEGTRRSLVMTAEPWDNPWQHSGSSPESFENQWCFLRLQAARSSVDSMGCPWQPGRADREVLVIPDLAQGVMLEKRILRFCDD